MKAPLLGLSAALIAGAISLMHCSGGDDDGNPPTPPQCVENLNVDCTDVAHSPPLYSTIFREIIQKQCALGSSCHGTDGAMGGLVLASANDTYDALLGLKAGTTKRVLPNDPKCSPLMVRLESRDPDYVMPRGSRLTEPELCEFVQWIKQGAPKN